jgi:hypothetical protein
MKRGLWLVAAMFWALAGSVSAWDCKATHPAINEIAGRLFVTRTQAGHFGAKYSRAPIDFSTAYQGLTYVKSGKFEKLCKIGTISANFLQWLGRGGHDADMPEFIMGFCHFYDPVYEPRYLTWLRRWVKKGKAGDEEDEQEYLDSLDYRADDWNPNKALGDRERKLWWQPKAIRPKIDGIQWALTHRDNEYSWESGLRAYKAGMEYDKSSDAERSALFGKAFRALGETLHMMGDMTQPSHVRADSHSIYEPLEKTVTGKMVRSVIGENWKNPDFKPTTDFAFESGLAPEALMKKAATFVNHRFFSNDTIFDYAKEVYPRNHKRPYPSPQLSKLRRENSIYYSQFADVGWVPLAKETGSVFSIVLGKSKSANQKRPKCNVLPEMAESQAKVLIPIAVTCGAEILDRFFPTLELTIKTEMGSDSMTLLSGELTHVIAKDPAWATLEAIRFNGHGSILVNGRKEASCIFTQGRLAAPPLQLASQAEITVVVEAGARKIRSLPVRLP